MPGLRAQLAALGYLQRFPDFYLVGRTGRTHCMLSRGWLLVKALPGCGIDADELAQLCKSYCFTSRPEYIRRCGRRGWPWLKRQIRFRTLISVDLPLTLRATDDHSH